MKKIRTFHAIKPVNILELEDMTNQLLRASYASALPGMEATQVMRQFPTATHDVIAGSDDMVRMQICPMYASLLETHTSWAFCAFSSEVAAAQLNWEWR